MEQSYHYQVIRRAIDMIDAADAPLALDGLAAAMGMSSAHFQRVFSQWAGVSPKRYQQYLALGHAKSLLRDRATTLAAADGAGLSGGGRLHDLFLTWEAMTPGDYARGGEGLEIRWGVFDTPFGPALATATDRGLCGLGFLSECTEEEAKADLFGRWPKAAFLRDDDAVRPMVEAAVSQTGTTRLHLIGGPFQIKVWEALLRVPEGQVTTYSDIAASIGHPAAVRRAATWR